MINILHQLILVYSSYERGKRVGEGLFFLALAGLGAYLIIRMNKKKKE
jgi:hypothetical protein